MKCDLKTMLKIGGVLAVILAGGYFFFPQFRPVIIGLAPFALFALCPLSMMLMMGGTNKGQHNQAGCASCAHQDDKKHSSTTT